MLKVAGAVCEIVQTGMASAKLPLSWDKTCFLLSNPSLYDDLSQQPGWALGKDKMALSTEFGGDSNNGSRRRIPTHRARAAEGAKLVGRLAMFGAGQVVSRLHRAAPLANQLWGAAVNGVSDT